MFKFYYDESEHSRKINQITIEAENYYDNFVAGIIGWREDEESKFEKIYLAFEEKYSDRKSKGELKSSTIKQKQLAYGFASLNKANVEFLSDFFDLFSDEVHYYFSVISKVEYVILQLFRNYNNSVFVDIDAMKYSITKAILVYRPKKVIDSIYNNPQNFVAELINFFSERIEINKANINLKHQENEQFSQIIYLLKNIEDLITLNWDYHMGFDGFKKYLDEKSIIDYRLTLDGEGEKENTLNAAKNVGLTNVTEIDSTLCFGVRMADMMTGIISKIMKQLFNSLHSNSLNNILEKNLLDKNWFKLNTEQFKLYKRLYTIVMEYDHYWYKTYSGIYSDDLISFISLLQYINNYSEEQELNNNNFDMHPEYYNAHACQALADRYTQMKNKLPVEPLPRDGKDYYFNARGAIVYYDSNKQPKLRLIDNKWKGLVMSVGFNKSGNALVTVHENDTNICYRLPVELREWAETRVAFANMGDNIFPCEVEIKRCGDKYFIDLL